MCALTEGEKRGVMLPMEGEKRGVMSHTGSVSAYRTLAAKRVAENLTCFTKRLRDQKGGDILPDNTP